MHDFARHTHGWAHLLARFAREMGMADCRARVLGFALEDGPAIVAELLDDGKALGLAVDLQQAPEDARLEAILAANLPPTAQDNGIYAYLPVNDTLVFFRRLEDAGRFSYEEFLQQVRDFARAAQAACAALPGVHEESAGPDPQTASASHAESFRHVWSDFATSQGLGRELPPPDEEGGHILALEGAGHVFVRPDAARGSVLLRTTLALLPLDAEEPAAWRTLLHAHTLGQATGGASFAVDAQERELIAWRSLPLDGLDAYGLNDAIDSLAEVARFYVQKLALQALPA